jgi:hypothetical protein
MVKREVCRVEGLSLDVVQLLWVEGVEVVTEDGFGVWFG